MHCAQSQQMFTGYVNVRRPAVELTCRLDCRASVSRDRQTAAGWRRGVVVSGVRQ